MDKYLLHHLFKDSAIKYPGNTAVIEGDKRITYRELDEKSSLVARTLIRSGLKPGEVVAVYINKSIEAIISFLGVLKAGAAYIPIDGNYSPCTRISTILDISETAFVLTNTGNWNYFLSNCKDRSKFDELNIVFTDNLYNESSPLSYMGDIDLKGKCVFVGESDGYDGVDVEVPAVSEDLAYILYTSGSTGVPKGVMLSHLNALTFVNWAVNYFNTNDSDIFSSHAPFHFDLSVFDIYAALSSGGAVNLIPFQTGQNPRLLFDWISKSGITLWYSVPSVWIAIMNHANPDFTKIGSMKKILFAGEEFPNVYLRRLMEAFPAADYYNLYGPTETNVCTAYHVKAASEVTDEPVPIGEACANTEIVVLNDKMEPADIGEEGELFVRGTTVTKGYYKNSERTELVYIKSPLKRHNGERLYRTGDLVVRLDERNYRFIGRIDNMVKISGFRIELQEIVTALLKVDFIEEAAVEAVYNEERGSKILHGFIKVRPGHKCSIMMLKEYCSEKLPYYMIPEAFVVLDEMPRNANGKIDSKKLLYSMQ
ncbi:amino acid adenylation domain-containing protein [Anaerobacterium chartisolvens]|uniref:Amino acid adenylation domain-containing protein n=1 Tax=Anaerobacterium chartisolvens TaxID=1297424 RepID=A0A369B9F1_9FIRM|nr:amino acid adenylation domain-containing protein [Anaerobacterium chartisolvens]RCX16304.1 amino acid adenylation domain-containing protein [Anaerobacterium chartisolvens]